MSNDPTRKSADDADRVRNAANEPYRPGRLADVNKSAGTPSTNAATSPTKPCGDDLACEMPAGSGAQQRIQATSQGAPGHGAAGAKDPKQQGTPAASAPNTPNAPNGQGGPNAPHAPNAPSSSGSQPLPRPQPPGRPKGQDGDQRPASTGAVKGPHDGNETGAEKNRDRRKTYEGKTGVSGEAGSAADDI
jgi:hypothetical protein